MFPFHSGAVSSLFSPWFWGKRRLLSPNAVRLSSKSWGEGGGGGNRNSALTLKGLQRLPFSPLIWGRVPLLRSITKKIGYQLILASLGDLGHFFGALPSLREAEKAVAVLEAFTEVSGSRVESARRPARSPRSPVRRTVRAESFCRGAPVVPCYQWTASRYIYIYIKHKKKTTTREA